MLKFLFFLLFFSVSLSVPVDCKKAAYALEMEIESLTNNDCEGRVCEEKCSCGKSIYFNLEKMLGNDYSASLRYHYVCTMDYTPNNENLGFINDQLKKSLVGCGYKNFANLNGFHSFSTESHSKSLAKYQINGRTHYVRVPYAPNILVSLAEKLKKFSRICQDKPDWKNRLRYEVYKIYVQVENENKIDYTYRLNNRCLISQIGVLQNVFIKSVLEENLALKEYRYCRCGNILRSPLEITNWINGKPGPKTVYTLQMYERYFRRKCAKICSTK
jgi:hypothetical protein